MLQTEFIPTLILFGLGLGLLLAAAVLAGRESHPARILLVGLFAAFAFSLLPSLFHSLGRIVSPTALNLGRTSHFILGPLALFYVLALRDRAPGRAALLHFIPALCAAILAWFVFPPVAFPHADQDHTRWLLHNPLGWIAGVHLVAYLLAALWQARGWRTHPAARPSLVLVLSLYIVGMSAGLLGMVLDADHRLAHIAVAALVPVLALHFILLMRQPALLGQSAPPLPREPGNPRLNSAEVARVQADLKRLMQIERLYLDEELSLARLAEELRLTPHQLSWFLNESLGENFYGLVNRYRVDAACVLLRDEPDRTVLGIAMAVGFNSKSSFHAAFTRITGQTPAAYRKHSNADK